MVEAARSHLKAVAAARKAFETSGLNPQDSPQLHDSPLRRFTSSSSAPTLGCSGGERATRSLGRRLMMAGPHEATPAPAGEPISAARLLSPLSCARRLREQRSSSMGPAQSGVHEIGSSFLRNDAASCVPKRENRMQGIGDNIEAPRFALCSDDEAEAAIEARLFEKGTAANPFAQMRVVDLTAKHALEQERVKRLQRAARADNARRMMKARESGELLPSEIPYDDRQEQAMERKINREMEVMLQKIRHSKSSYKAIISKPGRAEAFCKNVVMKDYVLTSD